MRKNMYKPHSPSIQPNKITGGRIARVIFYISKGEMILLHGFIKKSQKTPKKEIDLALKRKKEHEKYDQ